MRKLILFVAVLAFSQTSPSWGRPGASKREPTPTVQSVTGEQLEQILISAKWQSDPSLTKRIQELQLSERLSDSVLQRCRKDVPGKRAKEALIALADMSVFLPPPPSTIPALPKPDLADQEQMIARTVDYVAKTLHSLPDFYAKRLTTSFHEDTAKRERMHLDNLHTSTVYYRDGEEVVEGSQNLSNHQGLITYGVFGPILAVAITDAAKGDLEWSRWEKGAAGLMAVYSYSVKAQMSHYQVDRQMVAYSGEIAVEPDSGAILRIIVKEGEKAGARTNDIEVEYAPIELGGKTYICPTKSVAYSLNTNGAWLNDVAFDGYHLFRGEARILPGFTQVQ